MYAITATGFRAIDRAADAVLGETVVDVLPKSLLDSIAATEDARTSNAATLRQQGETALDNLRAYRDLASPTNAQTVAVVRLLCRVCIALIRLQLSKLDATD